MTPLLEARAITKTFSIGRQMGPSRRRIVRALNTVSLTLDTGTVLGIGGESGSGKSTLGRILARIIRQDSGIVLIDGTPAESRTRQVYARAVQMVFQDPYSSLNPKLSIGTMLGEAIAMGSWELRLSGKQRIEKIRYVLSTVGMPDNILSDYPHQFSGGQKQRLALARALALQPRVLIADEILSALDVSIQSQMLNLLFDLKEAFNLSIIFITHDLAVMSAIADTLIIMKDGAVVEEGPAVEVLGRPREDYTRALVRAVPRF